MYELLIIVAVVAGFGDGGAHVALHSAGEYIDLNSCVSAGTKAAKVGDLDARQRTYRGKYTVTYTCVAVGRPKP